MNKISLAILLGTLSMVWYWIGYSNAKRKYSIKIINKKSEVKNGTV